MSARHHVDLVMCRKQPGTARALLCQVCEGRCVLCDSYIRPAAPVRLCQACAFGPSQQGRCVICDGPNGKTEAWYCRECVLMEKDRDGCPKVVNVGSAKLDLWYERRRARQPPKLLQQLDQQTRQ